MNYLIYIGDWGLGIGDWGLGIGKNALIKFIRIYYNKILLKLKHINKNGK